MAEQSLYGGATDADLQALYAQLARGDTNSEMAAGGVANMNPGEFRATGTMAKMDKWFNGGNDGKGDGTTRAATAFSSPAAAAYQEYRKGNAKKKHAKKQGAAHKANVAAQNQYLADRTARMQQIKQEIENRQLKNRVNAYFSSDSMQGLYDTLQNQRLQNSLSQITQQYGGQLRDQSFKTAGQGLIGSSVDAERRGDVQQGQNAAAIQAQGQAQQFAQQARSNNEGQRQSLIGTLSSGNPVDGAAYNQQLQGMANQTAQMGQQYANTTAQNQINQQGYNMQSQALGGLLSAYGNMYQAGQQGAAYGGQGGGF